MRLNLEERKEYSVSKAMNEHSGLKSDTKYAQGATYDHRHRYPGNPATHHDRSQHRIAPCPRHGANGSKDSMMNNGVLTVADESALA